ncbi:VOC family protein [Roseibium aggregatum]|uniref:VOC family protein n=1 Tax=Roseibium aggregatum TaxID=187304 RepID=A0A939EF48_9HYPH|nr:VOC family protein [Roseibium aggregatum]MBN9671003.1 VOC family protein [Roseibium aggregatum]
MTQFRDLRYLRVAVDDLDDAARFAGDVFGLQAGDRDETRAMFRSDARNYAICFSTAAGEGEAVALTVAREEDLETVKARLESSGYAPVYLSEEDATVRQSKSVLAVSAPNGVTVEIVWRPLHSGWRYHGPRDAGIVEFSSVQLACTDIGANEAFWTRGLGLRVSDWVGDAAYLALDDAHHRIVLYPSDRNGILGACWEVDEKDSLMRNWYFLQRSQLPVVAGPDRQAASGAIYVTTRGPRGLLMTYVTEMEKGPQIEQRGPRQFANTARSHGIWGSMTEQTEFLGGDLQ